MTDALSRLGRTAPLNLIWRHSPRCKRLLFLQTSSRLDRDRLLRLEDVGLKWSSVPPRQSLRRDTGAETA